MLCATGLLPGAFALDEVLDEVIGAVPGLCFYDLVGLVLEGCSFDATATIA